jgi:hypothetical protein
MSTQVVCFGVVHFFVVFGKLFLSERVARLVSVFTVNRLRRMVKFQKRLKYGCGIGLDGG